MTESDKLQAYTTDSALAAKQKLADMAIEAKLVPSGMSTEQVILVMQKGHELGIPPTEALASMYVVNGRVTLEGEAMLGLIYNSGKCSAIEFEAVRADEPDKQGWAVTMTRNDMVLTHRETFTMADADKAGLLVKKETWGKYPRIMCRWRAVAACARIVFPDVIGGLYLPEELDAPVEVSPDGEVRVIASSIEDAARRDEEEDGPVWDDDLLVEVNELGGLLGYSAAKVRAEINKAGKEHLADLVAEWRIAVDALPAESEPDFDKPYEHGGEQRLIPEEE